MTLVAITHTPDGIGQMVPTETFRDIFCRARNVSFNEWAQAGQMGMQPRWKMDVFAADYSGETEAIYKGVRYTIYRTYQPSDDGLELYLEERAGDGSQD